MRRRACQRVLAAALAVALLPLAAAQGSRSAHPRSRMIELIGSEFYAKQASRAIARRLVN